MRYTAAVLILAAMGLLSPFPVSAQRVRLDAFAARVNGNVILESDVEFELVVMRMDPETRKLPVPGREIILERLIDRELLLDQARKFITKQITEADVTARMDELDSKYGGSGTRRQFLADAGISEEFWRIRIRNLVLLEKYIDQRFRAFVRISREDEDRYIRENAARLDLGEFEDPVAAVPDNHALRTVIRQLLTETEVNERIEELLQEQRTSADISRIQTAEKTPTGSSNGMDR